MKIAICENDEAMLDIVFNKITHYTFEGSVIVEKFSTGETLIKAAKKYITDPFDIVFMDICLTDDGNEKESPDGIDVAKNIKRISPSSLIVYMSSYSGFYVDLAQAEPFAFLQKPISSDALFAVLDDCKVRLNRLKYKYFKYKFDGREIRINLNDVVYFYSQHRTVHIRLNDGDEKYFYDKLDNVEFRLNEIGAYFMRINKSEIVNKIYIEGAYFDKIIIDGQKLNVTPKYKESYHKYLAQDRYF